MVDVSPSNKKVGDFLTSLSELSQSRIQEDQERQRELQRKVDELKRQSPTKGIEKRPDNSEINSMNSSSGLLSREPHLLKFNRLLREDDRPPLPRRRRDDDEKSPPLPRRRVEHDSDDEGPPLPRRKGNTPPQKPPKLRSEGGRASEPLNMRTGGRNDNSDDEMEQSQSSNSYKGSNQWRYENNSQGDETHLRYGSHIDNSHSQRYGSHQSDNSNSLRYNGHQTESGRHSTSQKVPPVTYLRYNSSGTGTTPHKSSNSSRYQSSQDEEPQYRSFAQLEAQIKNSGYDELGEEVTLIMKEEFSIYQETDTEIPQTKTKISKPLVSKKPQIVSVQLNQKYDTSAQPTGAKLQESTPSSGALFPKRVYYSSSSVAKGDGKKEEPKAPPPKPIKTNLEAKKSDWLTSSMANKKSTTSESLATPITPLRKPKGDWLSSTMSNSKTTISHPQDEPTPSPRYGGNSNDWMTSLSNSKLKKSPSTVPKPSYLGSWGRDGTRIETTADTSQANTSPSVIPSNISPVAKTTSWIDSALKKSDSHKYVDDIIKPSYQIIKKDSLATKPIQEESKPELLTRFEKLQPGKHISRIEKTPPTEETTPEYLQRLENIKKGPKAPPKPSKPPIDKYTQEETELLKSTMSKMSGKSAPPKPSKPSIEMYTRDESELLKSTMSKLSSKNGKNPPPKPSKPSIEKYSQAEQELLKSTMSKLSPNKNYRPEKPSIGKYSHEEQELLKSTMSRLSPRKKDFAKPSTSSYEKDDAEMLKSQLKKLGSRKYESEVKEKPDVGKSHSIQESENFQKLSVETIQKPSAPKSFQDQLSSILRASTDPNVSKSTSGDSSKPLTRSQTDPQAGKQQTVPSKTSSTPSAHPNKARAKGPRRRLPKEMQKKTSPIADYKKQPSSMNKLTKPPAVNTLTKPPVNKLTKPPVNKLTKPTMPEIKPTRNFSGELFL